MLYTIKWCLIKTNIGYYLNLDKCTVALLVGYSQHVTSNTSQPNQPLSAMS